MQLVVIRVAGAQAGGPIRVVIGRGGERLGDDVLGEQAVRRACEDKAGLVGRRVGPGQVDFRTAGRRGAQALGGSRGLARLVGRRGAGNVGGAGGTGRIAAHDLEIISRVLVQAGDRVARRLLAGIGHRREIRRHPWIPEWRSWWRSSARPYCRSSSVRRTNPIAPGRSRLAGAFGAWAGVLAPVSPKTCRLSCVPTKTCPLATVGTANLTVCDAARSAVPQFGAE